ncbi:hypothetical protein GCM10009560_69540 [Nonomuraea longicatena]|uniref:Uncharacterized protein n=1 Tax=Nonomuraea longicatena TaxID=83682 RepID=A0ABP4BFF6_9ACTN
MRQRLQHREEVFLAAGQAGHQQGGGALDDPAHRERLKGREGALRRLKMAGGDARWQGQESRRTHVAQQYPEVSATTPADAARRGEF